MSLQAREIALQGVGIVPMLMGVQGLADVPVGAVSGAAGALWPYYWQRRGRVEEPRAPANARRTRNERDEDLVLLTRI